MGGVGWLRVVWVAAQTRPKRFRVGPNAAQISEQFNDVGLLCCHRYEQRGYAVHGFPFPGVQPDFAMWVRQNPTSSQAFFSRVR